MKKLLLAVLMLALVSGCATASRPNEPADPNEEMNAAWVQNRAAYYRRAGWNSIDASYQAQADFENGRPPPTDRPARPGSAR